MKVIPAPQGGGSGTGFSHYRKVCKCPLKARHDKEVLLDGPQPISTTGAAATGTVFHQMAELYYGGEIDNAAVRCSDINWGESFDEARRLFSAFLHAHPGRNYWGEVVSVEEAFDVGDTVGFPLTARMDLVVRVEEGHNRRLELTDVGETELEPGYYIVDHKTRGRAGSDAGLMYPRDLQFNGYQMIYKMKYPDRDLKGMIANEVIGTKVVKFRKYLVPFPSEEEQNVVHNFLDIANNLDGSDLPLGLASGCKDYNRLCHHLINGRCNRI